MKTRALVERLNGASSFDLFHAIRLIERSRPDNLPVGMGRSMEEEVVQFRGAIALRPAPSAVQRVVSYEATSPTGEVDERLVMYVSAMGLLTPGGILPKHYTALALADTRDARKRHAREARLSALSAIYAADPGAPGPFGEYLDIIVHRLVSLWYRAWEQTKHGAAFERAWQRRDARQTGQSAHVRARRTFLGSAVGALASIEPTEAVTNRLVSDHALYPLAALLVRQPRTAGGLQRVLTHVLGVSARVRQFEGRAVKPPSGSCWNLGRWNSWLGGEFGTRPAAAILAKPMPCPQSSITIAISVVTWELFRRFVPTADGDEVGRGYRAIAALARMLVPDHVDCELELTLDEAAIQPIRLASEDGDLAQRLGWSSWLESGETDDGHRVMRFAVEKSA